jgi:hypothetical protein
VATLLAATLNLDAASVNTDWYGTMHVYGLLGWAKRGVPEAGSFARVWFEHQLRSSTVAHYAGQKPVP